MWQKKNILNIVGLAVIIYLSVIVFQTVKHNYDLNRQIAAQKKQIEDLSIREAQLKYDVQYYKTNSFIEKSARENLGLMMPGEGIIILPKKPSSSTAPAATTNSPSKKKSNPAQWWEFLFG
jgi:cell division protein FtsL